MESESPSELSDGPVLLNLSPFLPVSLYLVLMHAAHGLSSLALVASPMLCSLQGSPCFLMNGCLDAAFLFNNYIIILLL